MRAVAVAIRLEVIFDYYHSRNDWLTRERFINECAALRAEFPLFFPPTK